MNAMDGPTIGAPYFLTHSLTLDLGYLNYFLALFLGGAILLSKIPPQKQVNSVMLLHWQSTVIQNKKTLPVPSPFKRPQHPGGRRKQTTVIPSQKYIHQKSGILVET
jgi:hypothetical protein